MHRKGLIQEVAGIILVLLCSAFTIWAVFAYESNRNRANTVKLIAQAPEKGNWSPRTIRIPKGEEVTLVIRNVDVVSHGFFIPALDIMVREIKAGEIEKVTFTIDGEGEYPFYCGVWCSDYHMQMRGKLIVE